MPEKKKPGKLRHSRLMQFNIPETPSQTIKSKSQIFKTPMILVKNIDDKLTCVPETLAELSKIERTLNVVSVVGSLRTGKSFLLNKLAQAEEEKGFVTGHTTLVVTKGIWVFCRQHPTQDDQVLVLLDTEGVDDPDKVEGLDDKWLFVLSTLLCSTMVYNAKGNFEETTIDKFRSLREIRTSISVTGSKNDDSILDFFFPNFVLALRDFTLDVHEKTPDEFMEKNLSLRVDKRLLYVDPMNRDNLSEDISRKGGVSSLLNP